MTSFPKGVFGGSFAGRPEDIFILVSGVSSSSDESVSGLMFRGHDLLGTAARVFFVTSYRAQGMCASGDSRMFNGWDNDYTLPGGANSVYLKATLDPAIPQVTGTLRYLGGTQSSYRFSGGPIPGSTYDLAASPVVADIAGDWSLTDANGGEVRLSVTVGGKISGNAQGCALTGLLEPSRDSVNLFSVRLDVIAPCAANQLEGFAVALPLAAGGMQLLLWSEGAGDWSGYQAVAAIGRR